MEIKTIEWRRGIVRIVDQTRLPGRLIYRNCRRPREIWTAIRRLMIRGAPAIGIAAAFGLVLAMRRSRARGFSAFMSEMERTAAYLGTARPTAVNLFWALERMLKAARDSKGGGVSGLKRVLEREALAIMKEDNDICLRIGKHGARLLKDGQTVLTHCNAGGLATAGYGTALSVVFTAHRQGKKILVYVDETRPLLQGARLTAWELMHAGVETVLICDSAAARVMSEGKIDLVITGADRIAASGDSANKIGTCGLALLAAAHRIPFYIAAPLSTVDLSTATGGDIPIEERDPDEVRRIAGQLIAPRAVKVYNPAFDVTEADLIRGIITEIGIIRPPYRKNLAAALGRKKR